MRISLVLVLGSVCFWSSPWADARTLRVGAGEEFSLPSQAARAVRDGDVVQIEPGTYADCAVWNSNDLTIEATGPGVTLSDVSCDEKGIFVIEGNDVVVRGITFQRADVPDHNGAGIRAEGGNLTVERSTFLENQMGMLATGSPTSSVIVRDSQFARNGSCYPQCPDHVYMHALYVGRPIALLRVERSEFTEQHDGNYIKSRALRSEIVDNLIHDGDKGTGSYFIDIPQGGTLIASGNRLEKGLGFENEAAIAIGEEVQKNATGEIRIENNIFNNLSPRAAIFLWNMTATEPTLGENVLKGNVVPVVKGRR